MESYSSDLLDGFDIVYKRAEGILKSTHEIGSFMKKLANVRKSYAKDCNDMLRKYAKKKMLENAAMDGTVRNANMCVVTEVERIVEGEMKFTQQLFDMASELQVYVDEREKRRKKLVEDGHVLTKEMQKQLDRLKSAQNHYMKCSKDSEKAQMELGKAQADTTMKPAKLTNYQSKAATASEKANTADCEYKDVLRATNDKQDIFYTQEMPSLLTEFQNFEEDRIRFVHDTLTKFSTFYAELPPIFSSCSQCISDSVNAVDSLTDIRGFVAANKTSVSPPPAIEYRSYDGKVSNVVGGGSVGGGGGGGEFRSAYTPPAAAPQPEKWGLSDSEQNLSNSAKQSILEEQLRELERNLKSEEQQWGALEKLVQFYGNDPAGRAKAEEELQGIGKKIAALKDARETINKQLSVVMDGGTIASLGLATTAAAVAEEEPETKVRVRGLYDYTASNDTELSFGEGDILVVTEQDESGWWYATLREQTGFVPQNYVEVIKD